MPLMAKRVYDHLCRFADLSHQNFSIYGWPVYIRAFVSGCWYRILREHYITNGAPFLIIACLSGWLRGVFTIYM